MWEGVHVYETPEMKRLGGAPAVAEQSTEASRCRGPSAFPLRGDELQVPAPSPRPRRTSPSCVPFSFWFGTAYPHNAAKNMGGILRYFTDFAFENLGSLQVSPFLL